MQNLALKVQNYFVRIVQDTCTILTFKKVLVRIVQDTCTILNSAGYVYYSDKKLINGCKSIIDRIVQDTCTILTKTKSVKS